MKCEEARLLIGADPSFVSPELTEHLKQCAACGQFQREMIALEGNIRKALEEPPALRGRRTGIDGADGQATAGADTVDALAPEAQQPLAGSPSGQVRELRASRRGGGAYRPRRRVGWSGWAMAASAALVFIAAATWILRPTESLAHEVVAHVEEEPNSWGKTAPVASSELDRVLRKDGITIDSASGDVVYAQRCEFRGHGVPHLVVKTARGPVTVLILRYVDVKGPEHFQEAGMTGVITPAPRGSIAVLARGAGDIDDVAQQLRGSVHWLPDAL